MKIKYLAPALILMSLAGCMTPRTSPPVNMALVPNDCGNRETILTWLIEQAAVPRQTLETEENYERHRRQIRAKIWAIRYQCQPV